MFHPGIKPATLPSGTDLNIPQISRYPVEVHPLPKSRLFASQHHYDRSNCVFDINGGAWLTQDLTLPKRHLRNTNLPTAHHALSVCGMRVHPRTDQPPSPLREAPTRAPSRGRSQSRGMSRNTTSAPVIKPLAAAEDIVSPRPLLSPRPVVLRPDPTRQSPEPYLPANPQRTATSATGPSTPDTLSRTQVETLIAASIKSAVEVIQAQWAPVQITLQQHVTSIASLSTRQDEMQTALSELTQNLNELQTTNQTMLQTHSTTLQQLTADFEQLNITSRSQLTLQQSQQSDLARLTQSHEKLNADFSTLAASTQCVRLLTRSYTRPKPDQCYAVGAHYFPHYPRGCYIWSFRDKY